MFVPPRDCHIEFTGDTLKMPISDDLMGSMPGRRGQWWRWKQPTRKLGDDYIPTGEWLDKFSVVYSYFSRYRIFVCMYKI